MQTGKRSILAATASVIGAAFAGLGASANQAAETMDAFGNPLRGFASAEERDKAVAANNAREARKIARRSKFPSKAEIDAMAPEKRNYWFNRRFGSAARTLAATATWDKSNPSRQVRRHEARRANRMPIGMYSETWLKKLRESA